MVDKRVRYVLQADDRTGRVFNALRGNLGQLQSSGTALNATFGKLGVVFGSAFAGVTLTAFIKGQVDALDRLNDVSDATGASVENLSALENIAGRTGTSFDTVADSLVRFNKLLLQAKPGSEIEQTLKNIGLNAAELRRQDPAEAFRQVAIALEAFDDGPRKAQIVTALFQKNLQELAPLLKDVAEGGELVATTTAEQTAQADRLNKQLATFRQNNKDIARDLVSLILPALNDTIDSYRRLGGAVGVLKSRLGIDELGRAETKANDLASAVQLAGERLERMETELERAGGRSAGNERLALRVDKARERLRSLMREAGQAAEAVKGISDRLAPSDAERRREDRGFVPSRPTAPEVASARKPAKKEEIDDAARSLAAYIEQLDRQREKTLDLSEEQKALNFLQEIGTTGQVPQVRELVLGLASQNDALEEQAGLRKLNTDLAKEQAATLKSLDDELDSLSGRAGDRRKLALTERLEGLIAAGKNFSPAELERLVKGIAGITEQVDDLDEFSRQAGRNIQDALGSTVRETLRGDFDSIGELWQNLLLDMVSQAIAAQLGNALFGDFGKTGSLGGLFGQGLGAFLGFFDTGTDYVPRDGLAYIHEGEAILTREENARRGEGGWAAGPPVINQFDLSVGTINAGQGVSRGEVAAVVSQALAAQEMKFRRLLERGSA